MRFAPLPGLVALAALLSACAVGPDYKRPAALVPARYKEARPQPGWKLGQPNDTFNRGAWWTIYDDPVLDGLEQRIDISNQNLKAAAAALTQAEEIVAEARAGFFPTGTVNLQAQRSRSGGSASSGTGSSFVSSGGGSRIGSFFSDQVAASWTPDFWGQIRRTVEANVATAQASAADLASARLSAQGTLAGDYLQLRIADELKRLLDQSAAAYAESLRITQNQYRSGTTDQSAVSQAQAQLQATEAQSIATGVTRAQFEHAIAVLIGVPPAELTIAPTSAVIQIPDIPPGLPSALLERRPDIAAAERTMQAANAEIGVQVAAFYPTITLSADAGTAAAALNKLVGETGEFWSFGATLAETVFDAGLRHAQVQAAVAVFNEDLAGYRQTVLTAFQQVEDQLAALRILADEAKVQEAALAAAREAERVINNQYLAGTVAYTNVIVAEQTALGDAETALTIREDRLVASASLIQGLGGGWNAAQLPSRGAIETRAPLNFNPLPPILPVQGQEPQDRRGADGQVQQIRGR
ncbi:MAG TPA: efflux transporter outer membrane subunit [Stellaceae bacterium]|jgi:NodT family efflux transporter outer membrane factor (OMF) lipoprotein